MDKEELIVELETFNQKLNEKENLDENLKKNLRKLIEDIRNYIENSEGISIKERETLMENLIDSTMSFETKHPELSESLNIIVHTLSNMGI